MWEWVLRVPHWQRLLRGVEELEEVGTGYVGTLAARSGMREAGGKGQASCCPGTEEVSSEGLGASGLRGAGC
jgi:hypothetical protein